MITYRRKNDSDTWHWCRNCSNWPEDIGVYYKIELKEGKRPSSGKLDNECLALEKKKECEC